MHTLIIVAHPSKHGFSHKIASRYKKAKEELGDTVKIIDLYKHEEEISYIKFEDVRKDFPSNDFTKSCQKDVLLADEIVFIFPIWNFSEPALLKNWFDLVFVPRFAFRYTGKMMPEKLLKGRFAKIITTCDAPRVVYYLLGNPLKKIWKYGRFDYTSGVKLKSFTYFDRMIIRDDKSKVKLLKKVDLIAIK